MITKHSLALLALLAFSCHSAHSQSAPTGNSCADIQNKVNQAMQKRMSDSAPKIDPTTYNQKNYDIAGIMSQDVTAGLGKLMSLNFSGLARSLLEKGLKQTSDRGGAAFNSGINGVLSTYGANLVSMPGVSMASGAIPVFPVVATPAFNGGAALNQVGNAATNGAGSIYSRITGR